jgi:hypothetical protein
VTRLLNPPTPVAVTLNADGTPAFVSGSWTGQVDPIARWRVETEWWNQAVIRDYWKVVLNSNYLCELFHDVTRDEWFIERVYD